VGRWVDAQRASLAATVAASQKVHARRRVPSGYALAKCQSDGRLSRPAHHSRANAQHWHWRAARERLRRLKDTRRGRVGVAQRQERIAQRPAAIPEPRGRRKRHFWRE